MPQVRAQLRLALPQALHPCTRGSQGGEPLVRLGTLQRNPRMLLAAVTQRARGGQLLVADGRHRKRDVRGAGPRRRLVRVPRHARRHRCHAKRQAAVRRAGTGRPRQVSGQRRQDGGAGRLSSGGRSRCWRRRHVHGSCTRRRGRGRLRAWIGAGIQRCGARPRLGARRPTPPGRWGGPRGGGARGRPPPRGGPHRGWRGRRRRSWDRCRRRRSHRTRCATAGRRAAAVMPRLFSRRRWRRRGCTNNGCRSCRCRRRHGRWCRRWCRRWCWGTRGHGLQ